MKFFRGNWNSLSLDEQRVLNQLVTDAPPQLDVQHAIVKLLSDILDRIDYLERTRHYHDPHSTL